MITPLLMIGDASASASASADDDGAD
jgi:hypothetical protein